jgi:hypothetical protein
MKNRSFKKGFCRSFMAISFLLVCCVPADLVRAEEITAEFKGRTMEFHITIQANVQRLCAGGRLYDLIEAESAGDGPSIRPYVVAAVDRNGEHLPCPAPSETLPAD